ncbi:MAG: hypothetical protein RLZZ230_325 [Candidatus Parcubacteria bacterium]|jgi:hypothetical protein
MSPELITAVKERIERGYTDEAIRAELISAGYTEAVIGQVLAFVRSSAPISADSPMAIPVIPPDVPSAVEIVSEAIRFAFRRLDLIAALFAGPLVLVAASYFISQTGGGLSKILIITLASIVWNVLAYCATLYIITMSPERQVSFGAGLAWASENVGSFFWVSFLATMVVYGGMILFFIPSLIVAVLVGFAPYVYVKEGLKGMNAVLRSRELVRGRWWTVFKLGLIMFLLFFGLAIGIGIISSSLSFVVADSKALDLMLSLITQTVVSVFMIVGMFFGMKIYQWLLATKPGSYLPPPDKWKYTTLAWLGGVLPLIGILIAIIAISLSDARQKAREVQVNEVPAIDYKEQLQNKDILNENYLPPTATSTETLN